MTENQNSQSGASNTQSIGDYGQYQIFMQHRQTMSRLLSQASVAIGQLNMDGGSKRLASLSSKVESDTFKVMVVGTFKNGKSTFINALIGKDVLPAFTLPTTAVINELKYGEKPKAVLHFRSPLPERIPSTVVKAARDHMQAHGMKDVPPIEIPPEKINDYVAIPWDSDIEIEELLMETPYEKVELFWPLDILRNGVEVVDSPGLNECTTRTKVTMEYLTKADAIIMILNAQHLAAQDEMEFVEDNLTGMGFNEPFFVVNRINMVPEREKDLLMDVARKRFSKYSTNPIYFVNALCGVEAREKGDVKAWEDSGMARMERSLSDFLTKHKGRAKLVQPAKELKKLLNDEALTKVIPDQRAMMGSDLQTLRKRYEQAKPHFETLRLQRKQMETQLNLRIEQAGMDLRSATLTYFSELANKVPTWVQEYQPKTSLGLIPSKKKLQALGSEIAEYVKAQVVKDQDKWRNDLLVPLATEKAKQAFERSESDLARILDGIDQVKMDLSGEGFSAKSDVPVWERLSCVAGGLFLGDPGLAFSGGVFGFSKQLAYTAAFEFGTGIVLGLLGLLNPFTILLVVGGAIMFNWRKGQSSAMSKAKQAISDEMVNQIGNAAKQNADAMVEGITKKFKEEASKLLATLDQALNDTEKQVQNIIAEMEKGKANVEKRRQALETCEKGIHAISAELDTLIFALMQTP